MQRNIAQIIWFVLLLGFTSIAYFFSLFVQLPVIVTAVLVLIYGFFSYGWIIKNIAIDTSLPKSSKHTVWSYVVLLLGILIIVNKAYYLEHKYGDWDAWLIWNYHAKILQHPEYWMHLFSINTACHPDYPLFLPSCVAFLWRTLGTQTMLVPYGLSFIFTLAIPVTIFLSFYKQNLPMAALALLLLATDDFYLNHALAQYADIPLAFLFLCAIISAGYIRSNKYAPLIVGGLLGLCTWTKNEGIMLCLIFCLFYAKDLLENGRWKYFLPGIGLPLLALLVFKGMAPTNSLLGNRSIPLSVYLSDGSRYKLIASFLSDNLNNNFVTIKFGLILYALLCIVAKKWPGKNMWLLLTCVGGYFMVYVLSNENLEWHLGTSMDRVLLQLMPAFLYIITKKLSTINFSLGDKELQ